MNRITTDIKNLSITNQETLATILPGGSFDIMVHGKSICNDLDKNEDLYYFCEEESFTMEHPTDMNVLLVLYQGLVNGECKIVPVK